MKNRAVEAQQCAGRINAEDEYNDGYDEDWMGPRATAAEYPPSRRTGNSTEDWIPLPLTPPPVEAREQYAAPADTTPWQQQVVQAHGDLLVAQQHAWYPSAAPTVHYASDAMDTSAGRARGRAVRAKFPTATCIGRMTTPPKDSEQDGGQRGRCPRKEGNVAFEPLEYPREEDSHAYSVTTKEELLDWVKNGDQMYRDDSPLTHYAAPTSIRTQDPVTACPPATLPLGVQDPAVANLSSRHPNMDARPPPRHPNMARKTPPLPTHPHATPTQTQHPATADLLRPPTHVQLC
ncbi:hypothetical protein EDB85DRAFT_2286735 [Lactarius pseudohatsudake]|nr:hypothetical protein EDB85DRAFT_2286735 [Lactarius pseudohatsudake]